MQSITALYCIHYNTSHKQCHPAAPSPQRRRTRSKRRFSLARCVVIVHVILSYAVLISLLSSGCVICTPHPQIVSAAIARIYYAYPDPDEWSYSGIEGALVFGTQEAGFWFRMVDLTVSAILPSTLNNSLVIELLSILVC